MLPRDLSDNLISLLPGVKRMALSVFFWMDSEGNYDVDTYEFQKTEMINACKLSYDVVQE